MYSRVSISLAPVDGINHASVHPGAPIDYVNRLKATIAAVNATTSDQQPQAADPKTASTNSAVVNLLMKV